MYGFIEMLLFILILGVGLYMSGNAAHWIGSDPLARAGAYPSGACVIFFLSIHALEG
jgi:hypothetical protein